MDTTSRAAIALESSEKTPPIFLFTIHKTKMAQIFFHKEFIEAIKGFASELKNDELVSLIESDCRRSQVEPIFYGMTALEAAEKWFDSLCVREFFGEIPDEDEAIIVIQKRHREPFSFATWESPNRPCYSIPEEIETIAIQTKNNNHLLSQSHKVRD